MAGTAAHEPNAATSGTFVPACGHTASATLDA